MDKFLALLGIIICWILLSLLVAVPVWLLWEPCMCAAFDGVNPIGYWQAVGVMVIVCTLCKTNVSTKD